MQKSPLNFDGPFQDHYNCSLSQIIILENTIIWPKFALKKSIFEKFRWFNFEATISVYLI